MAIDIDELITKIEDTFGNEGTIFTEAEQDLIVDALILYKEINN